MGRSLQNGWMVTVGRAPRSIALVEAASGRRWTRAAVAAAASEWAGAFTREAGVSTSFRRRVALSVPNGIEWLTAFLGVLYSGNVPVPIDPSEPEEAQVAAARKVGASHIWRNGGLHALDPASGSRLRPTPSECLVKLTSGTSGAPEALSVTHAQMIADARQVCGTMGVGGADSNLAAIPLGYSYGLGSITAPLLVFGTRIVCISSPLPHALAGDIRRHKPTVFPAVPPLLRALALSAVPAEMLGSLRLVISAGSPLAPEVAEGFMRKFGVRVHGFYGTTETGGISYDAGGRATLEGRSVGRPLRGVNVKIGPSGRCIVSSPAVAGHRRFVAVDRARMNEWGELVLLGRSDRVAKVGGRRVDLAEVEAALRSVPGVGGAFAHVTEAPEGLLAAAVATSLSAAEVRGSLRGRLAPWKIPARLLVLGFLPATARGKVDTRALRQILGSPRTATSTSTLRAARQMSARR
ncbi:MAG TPA: class I adenylate-forming enzyme family protein [Opitutaceae bacterium]|jgi:acyl-CoA synthetase (AMP-forming)/AMP-acid ligase II